MVLVHQPGRDCRLAGRLMPGGASENRRPIQADSTPDPRLRIVPGTFPVFLRTADGKQTEQDHAGTGAASP